VKLTIGKRGFSPSGLKAPAARAQPLNASTGKKGLVLGSLFFLSIVRRLSGDSSSRRTLLKLLLVFVCVDSFSVEEDSEQSLNAFLSHPHR